MNPSTNAVRERAKSFARADNVSPARAWVALLLLCSCLFMCTAPGRITYPDDEIVFQTTQSLVEDHDLTIPGIPKRSGERADRPNGTFGWGSGRDGQRYGFFGHGTSLVAAPLYALARATLDDIPKLWRYAQRSDLYTFHKRGHEADWLRAVVSLTNCFVTPLAAILLGLWLQSLGHGAKTSLLTALIYALGTTAWPYAGTLLSEPLSAVMLLGAALGISRFHRSGARSQLWIAASVAGLSVHVHVLNCLAIPCLLGYALGPAKVRSLVRASWRTWAIALGLGTVGVVLLGATQWWRFGSPFETGRFDHYGHWVWPFRGLLTMLIAPGRSLFWYSPPLILAALAWPAMRRRDAVVAYFVLALVLTRLVFVACRSDWHGGWAIGPRYLLPCVPFLLVPLAGWLERWQEHTRPKRAAAAALLGTSVPLQAWLASHSVFSVFWQLNHEYGRDRYMWIADWRLEATPVIAFWRQQQPALAFWRDGQTRAAWTSAQFDALWFGAWRLSAATEADGLWWIVLGLGGTAALAAGLLAWWWWRVDEAAAQR
ncbi:hypothetical protein DB30_06570 [Enhygromyxa salina]|uniref:Glycosyltransferase RgtA/B/C/D-like domain-containing protein n=1 Tax=Enhygromyxa salina TaxID=215803 RepID=A0A0C1ZNB1_9BACT|nr:hypothetical protein [Enhygromyxa salina]KIG18959.1 hypothetical protein DB30_06570 [Enhygromyxa salina]